MCKIWTSKIIANFRISLSPMQFISNQRPFSSFGAYRRSFKCNLVFGGFSYLPSAASAPGQPRQFQSIVFFPCRFVWVFMYLQQQYILWHCTDPSHEAILVVFVFLTPKKATGMLLLSFNIQFNSDRNSIHNIAKFSEEYLIKRLSSFHKYHQKNVVLNQNRGLTLTLGAPSAPFMMTGAE